MWCYVVRLALRTELLLGGETFVPPKVMLISLKALNVLWKIVVILLGLAILLIVDSLPILVVIVLVVLVLALK